MAARVGLAGWEGLLYMVTPHVDRGDPARDGAGPIAAKGTPGRVVESGGRLGRTVRWSLVAAAAALVAVLATAAALRPDPAGFGTHRQLGPAALRLPGDDRPELPVLRHDDGVRLGRAWAIRPGLAGQPGGQRPGAACRGLVPWLALCGISAARVGGPLDRGPLIALLVATVGLGLAAWTFRLRFKGGSEDDPSAARKDATAPPRWPIALPDDS